MLENGQWQPGPDGGDKDKDRNAGLGALIRAIFGGGKQNRLPPWATQRPQSTQQLLRQLSGNSGQTPMPGGAVGAIQMRPLGTGRPQTGQVMRGIGDNYGGKGGEATFFAQSTRGGMAPISALGTLGRPQQWNPFDDWVKRTLTGDDDKDKPKPGDKDKPKGGTGGFNLDDMGGNR